MSTRWERQKNQRFSPEDKYAAYAKVLSGECGSLEDVVETLGIRRNQASTLYQAGGGFVRVLLASIRFALCYRNTKPAMFTV